MKCASNGRKAALGVATAVLALAILTGCNGGPSKPVSQTELLLGTTITITVYDHVDRSVIDKAFARVRDIHNRMTTEGDQSEVVQINREAGIKPVQVTPDVFEVIKTALDFSRLTDGAFDITVGPIVKLWGIGTDHEQLPPKKDIEALLPLVNWRWVKLNEADHSVYLEKRGMGIDLGGIAKGYAADEAKRILAQGGVKHAILDFGGNILVMGTKPDGSNWRIGIQTPFKTRGSFLGIVTTADRSVVTSGPYERYFMKDGTMYHHIIDPKTGYPVQRHLTSTTIYSGVSMICDGLSTSVFVMGLQNGAALIRQLKGVDAIFVTDQDKVYYTSGLDGTFEITNSDYTREPLPAEAAPGYKPPAPSVIRAIEKLDDVTP
ncbi:FAD:protein FMN transferase [Salinispira pacifica]